MKKIVYLNPFGKNEISGGIKVCYKHVEMLNEIGYNASVFSLDGYPSWFHTSAPLFPGSPLDFDRHHLVVFPETMHHSFLRQLAERKDVAENRILFAQSLYYIFSEFIENNSLKELGFSRILTVSNVAADYFRRVFKPRHLSVVPPYIDSKIFYPRSKVLRIAAVPRKLPQIYSFIRNIFATKYPEFKSLPWDIVDNSTELQTAEIFGNAAIFLSMPYLESFSLTPLEAMAAGCMIVGFDGYGGKEYANEKNGIWLPHDHLEETVDALAQALSDFQKKSERYESFLSCGLETAERFNVEATKKALKRFYQPLV